ncbi:wiskott-Aldrich syndrome protein homolog, partial [Neopelma chrysocephalum]|uniref:wiskott-Aldrich syndrome protein homolog n=1 Tax=Neopelma chrysocephalum TaxID=114329 RepID=UPI000FCD4387
AGGGPGGGVRRGGGGAGGGGGEWHKCPECGRGFGTSRALKVHRSYHVGRKRPQGHAPPPSSASHAPRGGPAPLSSGPSPFKFHYICAECGLGFAAPGALGAHRCEHGRRRRHRSPPGPSTPPPAPPPPRRAAPPPPPSPPSPPTPPPFRCTECAGAFGLVAELHEHYMLHARGEL